MLRGVASEASKERVEIGGKGLLKYGRSDNYNTRYAKRQLQIMVRPVNKTSFLLLASLARCHLVVACCVSMRKVRRKVQGGYFYHQMTEAFPGVAIVPTTPIALIEPPTPHTLLTMKSYLYS